MSLSKYRALKNSVGTTVDEDGHSRQTAVHGFDLAVGCSGSSTADLVFLPAAERSLLGGPQHIPAKADRLEWIARR